MEKLTEKIISEIKENQIIGNDRFLLDGFKIETLDKGNLISIEILLNLSKNY